MLTVAVISDTHMPRGDRRLPDACVRRLAAADAILHAGDLMELEVLHELQALGPPVHAVRGNVDSHELIARLPLVRTLAFEDVRIGMVHDAGPSQGRLARMRRRFPDLDAVVFGHSHIPLHERQRGFQIFNPGSPTDRRRQPRHTMGLAHVDDRALTFELIDLDWHLSRLALVEALADAGTLIATEAGERVGEDRAFAASELALVVPQTPSIAPGAIVDQRHQYRVVLPVQALTVGLAGVLC